MCLASVFMDRRQTPYIGTIPYDEVYISEGISSSNNRVYDHNYCVYNPSFFGG